MHLLDYHRILSIHDYKKWKKSIETVSLTAVGESEDNEIGIRIGRSKKSSKRTSVYGDILDTCHSVSISVREIETFHFNHLLMVKIKKSSFRENAC